MKRIIRVASMLVMAAASFSALGQGGPAKGLKTAPRGADAGAAAVAEEIRKLNQEYDRAFAASDGAALERLQTGDFRMTARGQVMTRAEMLARVKDTSRPRDTIESLTVDDVQVRVYGDAAVTTGRWKRVSKNAEGKDTSAEGFFTRVWVRRDNRWQMDVAHYSPKAAPARQQ